MSGDVEEIQKVWVERVLGVRLRASEGALRDRFGELSESEGDRLKVIRDALPRAGDLIAAKKLGTKLKDTAVQLRELTGADLPAKGVPDPTAAKFALQLGYDIAEALQTGFLDSVPSGTFQDIILTSTEKAQKWQEQFVEWVDTQDRDIGQIADQLLERRLQRAKKAAAVHDAVTRKAAESGYAGAEALGAALADVLEKCPAVADHFSNILTGPGATVLRFSDTASDAFYSKKGDPSAGVPDNCITLAKGKPASDMLDALIFESCNAEFQKDYDALNKDLTKPLQNNAAEPALGAQEYGRMKLAIEAKTILKDAQLKFAMQTDGASPAYQGQRNMFAMLESAMKLKGTPIADAKAIMDDPERLAAYVKTNEKVLGEFLRAADTDPEVFSAMLDTMAATPHKANTAPGDTQGLKTAELYAYEMLEKTSAQLIANMIIKDIAKAVDIGGIKAADLRKCILDWLRLYDVKVNDKMDSAARNQVIAKIMAEVKRIAPQAAFENFTTTDEMDAMAAERYRQTREGNPEKFEEGDVKQTAAIVTLRRLFGVA